MSEDPVLFSRQGGVATITLNAPERLNAIDSPMGAFLDKAMVEAAVDPEVRVIVVTGAGRGFCAGASMARLSEVRDKGLQVPQPAVAAADDVFAPFAEAPPQLRSRYLIPLAIPKPVIAAVNGPVAGAGLALALACDIRLAGVSAKFVASFAARGLVAEGACAYLLPRLVGLGLASDMLMSARAVGAEEALRAGLVSAVEPDAGFMAYVDDYAGAMARTTSPTSLRLIKQQLRRSLQTSLIESVEESLAGTRDAVTRPDFAEALAAYGEKRDPRFSPLVWTADPA